MEPPSEQGGRVELGIAAEGLRRVNRTRQVVSLVSQLIIRSYDEEALHAETCRFLVTFGGYLMAWVGLAEEKPEKIIRPVAHAGLEPNFLQALKIAWSNDLESRSPTSRAVLEQRPYVARRIPTEPRLEGLRSHAEMYGYTATCALPMQFGSHGMGVLTIHAAEPDAFGAEEVSLLRELANDLAAGVIGLREKLKREILEEHTRKAEARYRGIIENARDGIFQSTIDGKLLMVNDALVTLLGYPDKESLLTARDGTVPSHLHPQDSWPALVGRSAPERGEPLEVRLRRKDDGWVWVSLSAQIVESQDGPFIEGFVRDMTGPRAQQEANARLAAVIDAAEDSIIGIDANGIVSDWNQGAARLFGYTREEAQGKPLTQLLVPPERAEEARRIIERVAKGQRIPRFETMRRRKSGSLIHTSVTISPMVSPEGEVIGCTVVEHDITAAKRAKAVRRAQELEDAEVTKLKSLEKIRRTFLSEASHELNTPLTPLRIHVESLMETPNLSPKQRQHLIVIERNVLRLCALVKDMLEASRLETGRFKLELAEVPVGALLGDVAASVADTAAKAGVTISLEPAPRLVVTADRNRVSQVLYNLVTNAISFSPPHGIVQVSAKAVGDEVVVRIADEGVGLTSEQLAQLFQPFSRPHEGTGSAPKGTGLGLFISKGIIEQHGGRIWAESEGAGKGATFCFALPLTRTLSQPMPMPTREAPVIRRMERSDNNPA